MAEPRLTSGGEAAAVNFKTFCASPKQIRELPTEVLPDIQLDLIQDPKRGDIVKGTHGVRKARVADPGSPRGKSGGYRYLYLYLEHAGRIHLLYLFSKQDQANLSPDQTRVINALSQQIKRGRE